MSQHTAEAQGGGLQVCGESCVLRISHVTHIRISHVTHIHISHVTHIRISHVTHMRISHVTHIRVTCETHSSVSHGKGVSAVRRWGGREGERGG